MRRAVARGRVFPQSYSTDRRYGRLSLKACALFPLMWANADDQGRLCGDPEEVKYAACPNIDHITKADTPQILVELEQNQLIKVYDTSKSRVIQLLDWWDVHRPQWAWPSDYQPPEGWQDHLRFKKGTREVVTQNWFSGESQSGSQVNPENLSGEGEKATQAKPEDGSGETQNRIQVNTMVSKTGSGKISATTEPLPSPPLETERGKRKRRGRGNSPETQNGSQVRNHPSPSLTGSSLFDYFNEVFPKAFGRKPASRETAQLRDLGKEISSAGGATSKQVYDAFKEACDLNKFSISYVRAVLLDWLGLERGPPA